MVNWFDIRPVDRCARKQAFRSAAQADALAEKASKKTGGLIISYQCFECGGWHIGHADKSQIAARKLSQNTRCLNCGERILIARLDWAKRSGTKTNACSQACALALKKARREQRKAETTTASILGKTD